MLELGKIHLGDCLDHMKQMPDKSIDLILTDPPYGKSYARGNNGIGSGGNFDRSMMIWDEQIPPKEVFGEMFRVSRNQIIWGFQYFVHYLRPTNCVLIWDKLTGDNPYADCELAWTSFNSVAKKYTQFWLGSHIRRIEDIIHPTQKSSALIGWCVDKYSKMGDIIYDPFMGSGTTAVACERLGRRWVGSEISEEYVRLANKRIEAERSQLKLAI